MSKETCPQICTNLSEVLKIFVSIRVIRGQVFLLIQDSLDFRIHSAEKHKSHHFIIGDKRPERIFKGCGSVFFDRKVRQPREGVADRKAKRNKKISAIF